MGRVWLQAATLAHGECALLLVKAHCDLEKNRPGVEVSGCPRVADAIVIVDHENVGDDRRRHQGDMRGGRQ